MLKKWNINLLHAMYHHILGINPYTKLFWILVDNDHQRKGIASRLIDIMISESAREKMMSSWGLHVVIGNKQAIPLYKSVGFRKKID